MNNIKFESYFYKMNTFQKNRVEQILGLFAWLADLTIDLDIQARIIELGQKKEYFEELLMPYDRQIKRKVLGLIDQQITWLQQNRQA